MTNEDRLLIQLLKKNTKQLFKAYNETEKEKKLLENKVEDLENEINKLKQDKLELVGKIENIKLAKQFYADDQEKSEAKKRINNLVREIDKCIALLNK